MKKYKKLHIIKHALEMYIIREDALENDLKQERKVLREVTVEIGELKRKFNIKEGGSSERISIPK